MKITLTQRQKEVLGDLIAEKLLTTLETGIDEYNKAEYKILQNLGKKI